MGRGDKKSRKGKRTKGSYGVSRNRNTIKARLKRSTTKKTVEEGVVAEAPAKPKRTAKKKAE
jgi:ribosomal small subunit protein bTHX